MKVFSPRKKISFVHLYNRIVDYDVERQIFNFRIHCIFRNSFSLLQSVFHTLTQKKNYKLNLWFTKWSHFNNAFPAYYMDITVIDVFNFKICSKKCNLGLSLLKPIFLLNNLFYYCHPKSRVRLQKRHWINQFAATLLFLFFILFFLIV